VCWFGGDPEKNKKQRKQEKRGKERGKGTEREGRGKKKGRKKKGNDGGREAGGDGPGKPPPQTPAGGAPPTRPLRNKQPEGTPDLSSRLGCFVVFFLGVGFGGFKPAVCWRTFLFFVVFFGCFVFFGGFFGVAVLFSFFFFWWVFGFGGSVLWALKNSKLVVLQGTKARQGGGLEGVQNNAKGP